MTARARPQQRPDVREVPPAVQWHEGMLLAPQHFQQSARRHDAIVHYHTAVIAPYHWGVRHLKIDQALLVEGSFRVLELEAVMPDGLIVSHQAEDSPDLTVDLTSHVEQMRLQPLTVHLAVPAVRPGMAEVSGELARYDSVEGRPVVDVNTGDGELRLPRLRPRLRLLASDDPPPQFVSFPLARLVYSNEAFTLSRYVPPMLWVPLRSPLGRLANSIAQRLREKAIFLSEQARSSTLATRAPQVLERKLVIHSLVAALPQFEAVLATGIAHPFVLYLALCAVVGQTATIGHAMVPPTLSPYDHTNIYRVFDEARKHVFRVLEEGIAEAYTSFPFYLEEGAFFLAFDQAWVGRDLILGVRARDGASERETVAWIEQSLIGSKSRIPSMQAKRIRGAGRQLIDAEVELVPGRGVILFRLANDPQFIVPKELLEIRNLDDPDDRRRPTEIVLYLRNQREDRSPPAAS